MMSANGSLVECLRGVHAVAPIVIQTAGADSDVISMRNCEHLTCIVMCGALGSATYLRITPYQGVSQTVAATAFDTPPFYWVSGAAGHASTADTWTKTAWGSNAYVDLTVANTSAILEIDASMLTPGQWSFKLNLDSDHNTGPTAGVFFFGTNMRYNLRSITV